MTSPLYGIFTGGIVTLALTFCVIFTGLTLFTLPPMWAYPRTSLHRSDPVPAYLHTTFAAKPLPPGCFYYRTWHGDWVWTSVTGDIAHLDDMDAGSLPTVS
jgi:hypothetical protein